MIRGSGYAAAGALTLSLALHGALGAGLLQRARQPEIEGGATGAVARLGNSFQDMAQGVQSPVRPEAPQKPIPPVITPQDVPAVTAQDAPSIQQAKAPAKTHSVTAPTPGRAPRAAPITPLVTAMPVTPVPPAPASEVKAEPLPESLAALPQPEDAPAPVLSVRPALRPKAIEEAATARAPKPKPRKTKPKAKRGTQAPAQKAGSDTGTSKGTVAKSTKRKGKAPKPGNAKASNYAGLVNRAIARVRKPNVGEKGGVTISFTISASGKLARARISRSSGNGRIDRAALQLIRRARFPKPPPGAETNFNKQFRWD